MDTGSTRGRLERHVTRVEVPTGVSLVLNSDQSEDGGSGQKLTVPCLSANMQLGEKEIDLAAELLKTKPVKGSGGGHCMLALEIPMKVNRGVARHAAEAGCFVGLKASPLAEKSVEEVRDFLVARRHGPKLKEQRMSTVPV